MPDRPHPMVPVMEDLADLERRLRVVDHATAEELRMIRTDIRCWYARHAAAKAYEYCGSSDHAVRLLSEAIRSAE